MSWFRRWWRGPAAAAAPPGDQATEDDIRACFRLLLGRPPNPEEWRGHSAQAGQPLKGVVAGYLNSLEFMRRDLLTPREARPEIAELDGFRLFADPGDLLIGRHVLRGEYEPDVVAVLRDLLRPGMAMIDIGANIGFFSMLAASLVGAEGAVLAVEPNPANVRLLEASRRMNRFDHVTVAAVAAGWSVGVLLLHTMYSNGTTSEPPAGEPLALLGAQAVPCVPVDALVLAAWPERRVDVIKIDVEGAEYTALVGAAGLIVRDRPAIISEFSPAAMPGISGVSGADYLGWLFKLGYAVSVIEPGGPGEASQSAETVLAAYDRAGADHIDLLARPV